MHRDRQLPRLVAVLLAGLLYAPLQAADIKQWSARAETGESQLVLRELAEYLNNNPEDYAALFLQGRIQTKQGDMQAAIETYQRLINQQPSRPEAYNNLAALYAGQGDYEQAQHLLEQAMRTNPSYATVYENLSQIYVEKARSSYGKALQLDAAKLAISLQELKSVSEPAASQVAQVKPTQVAAASTTSIAVAPKQVPAPAPQPASRLIEQPPLAFDEQSVITTLQGWAAAWSEQAADVYLIFYADDYSPEGMSRQAWEQERRERLKKPEWIKIGLSDFKVTQRTNGEAEVQMIQEYRASNYQDKTRKRMRLRETPDGWRIIDELTLAGLQ